MNPLKKLLGQTAVYGLSSILGRLLNFLLVPLYTRIFIDQGQYGIVTELYAYATFLLIVFTYGMETAFFRFWSKSDDKEKLYSTSLISLSLTSIVLGGIIILFSQPIANWLQYPDHPEYISWFAAILALDAITAIPFARLRQENKPLRFALSKSAGIVFNVLLNLYFLVLCPWLFKQQPDSYFLLGYDPEIGIGYIFIANLFSSIFMLLLLSKEVVVFEWKFDTALWKNMVLYSLPLLIAGLAGMTNETIDRILLKFYLPGTTEQNLVQTGIYGACYKLSIFMTLAIQAFRMASEPFYFSNSTHSNAKAIYALVMKHFVIVCCFIFLGIMLYIDIFKHFIGPDYWAGLAVVPILLLANLFLGVYYNLSICYKLSGKTSYGAYIAIFGSFITLTLNFWWIPIFGYMGSAWATLICYFLMSTVCYFLGRRTYDVPYPLARISGYILGAIGIYFLSILFSFPLILTLCINTGLLLTYAGLVYVLERPRNA